MTYIFSYYQLICYEMFLFLRNVRSLTYFVHVEISNSCIRLYIYEWYNSGPVIGGMISSTNSH